MALADEFVAHEKIMFAGFAVGEEGLGFAGEFFRFPRYRKALPPQVLRVSGRLAIASSRRCSVVWWRAAGELALTAFWLSMI